MISNCVVRARSMKRMGNCVTPVRRNSSSLKEVKYHKSTYNPDYRKFIANTKGFVLAALSVNRLSLIQKKQTDVPLKEEVEPVFHPVLLERIQRNAD